MPIYISVIFEGSYKYTAHFFLLIIITVVYELLELFELQFFQRILDVCCFRMSKITVMLLSG